MIYSRETSTKMESSQKELMRELLDLIDVTSQPQWSPSPIEGTPPESELDSESLLGSESGESESEPESFSDFYWEDEENPGGEGPPLVVPQ
ncbi:ORF3 [Torque teno Leptonychotes weddellii virus-1]|uniref:ORF3 n=1 Tax=Torque teno Leptonychotes weddellii virus-1 TaxID=2012676 RepID=A0A1Z2RWG0_9VIRU|nr:ORF3 [Torque teno Leptonychotes weddellii virus 1]ASA48643.1 ORF3 [Torque teno Leptonychotes weddellii virus 1]ASA48903.1 ORF3 [Torque teno Leptonychotes weddellii virus 1]ASA49063.1 ORF3 [Torque teno Leptonychotes weddellii virus 1]